MTVPLDVNRLPAAQDYVNGALRNIKHILLYCWAPGDECHKYTYLDLYQRHTIPATFLVQKFLTVLPVEAYTRWFAVAEFLSLFVAATYYVLCALQGCVFVGSPHRRTVGGTMPHCITWCNRLCSEPFRSCFLHASLCSVVVNWTVWDDITRVDTLASCREAILAVTSLEKGHWAISILSQQNAKSTVW